MKGRVRDFCRSLPNQTEVTVKGRHFLQEDSPEEIGDALAAFVKRVRGMGGRTPAKCKGTSDSESSTTEET